MYRHFKGGLYEVLDLAVHSETLEEMVVYRHLDGDDARLWVRPATMFSDTLERDGTIIRRFTSVESTPDTPSNTPATSSS